MCIGNQCYRKIFEKESTKQRNYLPEVGLSDSRCRWLFNHRPLNIRRLNNRIFYGFYIYSNERYSNYITIGVLDCILDAKKL